MPREKACILYLRKNFDYSINNLAHAFGRSRSLIHKIIKFNRKIGNLNRTDFRFIKAYVKKIATVRQRKQLWFYMKLWQKFIMGIEAKPP